MELYLCLVQKSQDLNLDHSRQVGEHAEAVFDKYFGIDRIDEID